MASSLLIGAIAIAGILFAPLASRIIRKRMRKKAAEAGAGDGPEPVDRGPGGMRM